MNGKVTPALSRRTDFLLCTGMILMENLQAMDWAQQELLLIQVLIVTENV